MLKVGLTGSIAVGKSVVARMLEELGCRVFDADRIAHALMEPGRPAYAAVVSEFGEEILAPDRTIDRAKLGHLVFSDPSRRSRLNEIVHPLIMLEQDRLIMEAGLRDPHAVIVVDAALMIESGGYRRFDRIVVVFCDRETQILRLMERNRIERGEAEKRIAAQMSSDEKRRYADFEIDTSGGIPDTPRQVLLLHEKLAEIEAGGRR